MGSSAQGYYPQITGEVGVDQPWFNDLWPVGDVRRYGVHPDGTTNWETDHPDRIAAIRANSLLTEVYWPPGDYATSLNMSSADSGSQMFFDRAYFGGVVHVVSGAVPASGDPPIQNVVWRGWLGTYDRFGMTNCRNSIMPETIHCMDDQTKNIAGTRGRGAHLYILNNGVVLGDIIIDGCGNGNNTDAALAMDGSAPVLADRSTDIRIGNVWIKDSETHGVYCSHQNVDIKSIRVDGYGGVGALNQLQDSDSLAQSQRCCGVWINRASGRIGNIRSQAGGTARPNAIHDVLFDEVGVPPAAPSLVVGDITLPAVGIGGAGRGLSFADRDTPTATGQVNVECGSIDATLYTGATLPSGWGMVNLNTITGSTTHRTRLFSRRIRLVATAAQRCVVVQSQAQIDCPAGIACDGHNGQLLLLQGQGAIGPLRSTQTGGTPPNTIIDIDTPSGPVDLGHVMVKRDTTSPITITALRLNAASNISIGPGRISGCRSASGTVAITGCTNIKLDNIGIDVMSGTPTAGVIGIRFAGASAGIQLDGVRVAGAALGLSRPGTLTNSAAYATVVTGCTVATDIPAGGITTDSACTGVTL